MEVNVLYIFTSKNVFCVQRFGNEVVRSAVPRNVSRCRTDHATPLYPQKLKLTSATSGCRLVGIVRSWTKATELVS
jgi:hypothetical protein